MAKKIVLYKFAKDLGAQLEDAEEEAEEELDDNEQFVTLDNDGEEDGMAVLQEYNEKLFEFSVKQKDERDKLVQCKLNCVMSNLQKQKSGDAKILSRLMNLSLDRVNQQKVSIAQEELNVLQDRLQVIRYGELFTFFRVRDKLVDYLDMLSDDIFMVASHNLNHAQLVAIADKSDCAIQFDLRDY